MRAPDGGWDFVRVGGTYQYKEDDFIAMVTVVEDNSDDKYYTFKLQVEQATYLPFFADGDGIFEISHIKQLDGVYTGMLQLYKNQEYWCTYAWHRRT